MISKKALQLAWEDENDEYIAHYLYALANAVIKNGKYQYTHEDKQDIQQELVLKALSVKKKYNQEKGSLYSFFYRVMQNRLYSIQRKSIRRKKIREYEPVYIDEIETIYTHCPEKKENWNKNWNKN